MHANYRLGIDLGVNSLGWCLLRLNGQGNSTGLLDIGVRLFSDGRDPKKGTSLAADRRLARQMRRRRDRYLGRRENLMSALVRFGLMPLEPGERKKLEALDPYELRARGLDKKLDPHHLGRAIFHLNQRRGFRSSRKTDKGGDDEKERGKIETGVAKLRAALTDGGFRTVGEYLWARHEDRRAVRVRLAGRSTKEEYEFYPQRALVESEFDTLWQVQARHHPDLLTEGSKAALKDIIFHQRPLKPVDPGRCTLDPTDERAPRALPLAQRFRMYQELNNLRIVALDQSQRDLTKAERDKLFSRLESAKELTFEQMRKPKLLGLESTDRFNLEGPKRKGLKGDETGRLLADPKRFGKAWWDFDEAKQNEIVEAILAADDEDALFAQARAKWGLNDDAARAVARVPLPDGYALVGRRALARIVPILRDQGLSYYDAAKEAGYEPSDFRGDGSAKALPDYRESLARHLIGGSGDPADSDEKRLGRFPNPTVHIGLNQLHRLVNELIAAYGKPTEIVIELARDLKRSRKERKEADERQATEQARNDRLRAELVRLGQKTNRENLIRLKLWEELGPPHDRRCIYTGEPISVGMVFGDSVAVDHVLPFKETLDDSLANRLFCLKRANDYKRKRAPFEAFGQSADGYDWKAILLRAENLPGNKRWRFAEDAMQRYLRDKDFLARHLTDTAYLARIAREYLGQVCHADRIWAVPGTLTALLRGKWGLNGILSSSNLKNRADHRHHAIDAFVVACTDRALLKRMSDAAAASRLDRTIEDMPDPWDGFDRDILRERVRTVVVSLKPDRGRQGRLHEETAYGLVADPAKEDGATVVSRKTFIDLNEKNEIARIRDPNLRARVQAHVTQAKRDGKTVKDALIDYADNDSSAGNKNGVRRVRLLKVEDPASLVPIRKHDNGKIYKAMSAGENWCIDVFQQPDGKWIGAPVTMFQANRPESLSEKRKGHPAARRVLRVHKGDYLKLDHDGAERIFRVVRLEAKAQRFRLAEHHESGNLDERHNDQNDSFRWLFVAFSQLKVRKARKVSVDAMGRVRDPGPPK